VLNWKPSLKAAAVGPIDLFDQFSMSANALTTTIKVKSHNVDSAEGAPCDSEDRLWWPQLLSSKRDYVARVLSPAKGKRRPRHLLYGVTFSSRHHGYRNPHSWVPRIKQKIPAFDGIDIAVVGVCPSSRPGLSDCEPVAAIREMLMACHHSHAANGKVVLTSKVRVKMFI
jgi:hypothetical protein